MNASVAKKTQDTLGKVIKKPPLTEKLLSKPPFRYLHDILSEVIRTTGFMKGLYLEAEMKSDNVKEKDAKMAFLQKAIDVVMLVSGESLMVRPARIVAGHEPEKTNELLQAIGKCCLNKLSSEEAVKRVLAGDKPDPKGKPSTSKSQDKENQEGRERQRDKEEKKDMKERSGSREEKEREESRRPEKDRHREGERPDKGRERVKDRDREKDKTREKEREKDKEKARERDPHRDRDRDKRRDRDKDKEREKDKDREREKDKDREREKDKDKEKEKDKDKERHKEPGEKIKEAEKTEKKSRAAPEETRNRQPQDQPVKTMKTESEEPADVSEFQSGSPARIPRPSSAKGQRRRPKHGGQDETDSEGEADSPGAEKQAHLENGDATDSAPPQAATSRARRMSRPSSARPAPPRVRKQESHSEAPPAERLGSSKPPTAVIVDGKKLSEDEDEDEQFVVEDARPPPMLELEAESTAELQGDEKHGGLVKKILETKKNYETSPSSPKSKDQGRSVVSEVSQRKEREMVSREMDRLRSSIQTVCRSALPLGKIMDYIQEDMDSMQNELQTWRRENQEHAQALLQEQRVTDDAVEPLKAELVELEQLIKDQQDNIKDQQDKICAVKSNILKNEEKIQKMLSSINFSSRT
ncbi:hypothetical protein SKAU_G00247740 [Synaphobranchus kaupii]|uniref:TRAF3-interacting protein 1 n=1 Tax=Synaphobranchus kaupii TaxID=118154 RepID=A0A9Q1F264_SYNKA|nr:hypothetical protein SKAU_G00247740 [Synaphobranchus kaupii]